MIAYSPNAELARAYLLRTYNDIDIFVEDCACQNMYVRLFGRLLQGKARVNHVFPLGGRNNVVKGCLADQAYRERHRIYIVDADHDLLLGCKAPPLRHLYRLKVYCAENLLISERAAICIAMEGQPNVSWQEAAALLNFQAFFNKSVRLLIPLFAVYAIINKLDLSIESVNYSVIRLLVDPNDADSLSEERIAARVKTLSELILTYGSTAAYKAIRKKIDKRLVAAKRSPAAYVSGKAYLLPLLQLHLNRFTRIHDRLDSLKVRLAQHADLSIDHGLRRALLKELKNSSK